MNAGVSTDVLTPANNNNDSGTRVRAVHTQLELIKNAKTKLKIHNRIRARRVTQFVFLVLWFVRWFQKTKTEKPKEKKKKKK